MQIETPQAWDCMGEIAAVEGVDAVFIGPGDLSANMGHLGNLAHPDVMDRVLRAPDIIHAQGCKAGVLMPNMELARQCAHGGYDFVVVASDLATMLQGVRAQVQTWGGIVTAAPAASAAGSGGSTH